MTILAHLPQNLRNPLSEKHRHELHRKWLTHFTLSATMLAIFLHPFPVQAGVGMSKGVQIVEDEIRSHVVGLIPASDVKEEKKEEGVIKTKCQPPMRPRRQVAMNIGVSASPLRREGYVRQESVFKKIIPGKDGRIRVDKTTQWPHSVHGVVVMRFPRMPADTLYGLGTGALIAPNVVLTCAHNLYNAKYGGRASSVRFLPAINRKELPFDESTVKDFCYPEAYTKDKWSVEDYGILILDTPLGEETGYFGLSVLSQQDLKDRPISISGYPKDKVAEKDREYELWGMKGHVHALNLNYIEYEIDTYGGQSGSPVCYQHGDNYYVVGIHVLEDEARGVNKATRLTEARYNQINAWIKESLRKRIKEIAVYDIQTINLNSKSLGNTGVKELAQYHLPNLIKLNLRLNYISSAGIKALSHAFASGKIPALKELNLEYNQIGTTGAQILAKAFASANLLALTVVNVANNEIGKVGAQVLAQAFASGKAAALKEVNLGDNQIEEAGAQALAQAFASGNLPALASVSLHRNQIKDAGTQALAKAFASGKTSALKEVNLGDNQIEDVGAQALAQAFASGNLPALASVSLHRNQIKDAGTQALAKAFASGKTPALKEVNLGDNQIEDVGAQALAQAFASGNTPALSEVCLSSNQIGDAGAQALGHAFASGKTPALSKVDLGHNQIGAAVKYLAQAFASGNTPALSEVRLSSNRMGNVGAQALGHAFASGKTPALSKVDLELNAISDVGAQALAQAFASGNVPALSEVYLSSNQIGDIGTQALAQAFVSANLSTLTSLNLAGNEIEDTGAQALAQAFAVSNAPALNVNLEHNNIGDTGVKALAETRAFAYGYQKSLTYSPEPSVDHSRDMVQGS